jgi:hypothetical protein
MSQTTTVAIDGNEAAARVAHRLSKVIAIYPLRQMQGSMGLERCPDPAAFERGNYARVLQSWRP